MWFNWMQRQEPYQGLTMSGKLEKFSPPSGLDTRWCMVAGPARVGDVGVKSRNERNPCPMLPASNVGDSWETAGDKSEEGGDDVKSSCPLCLGLHTCYIGRYKGLQNREVERIPKSRSRRDWRLQLASMVSGVASNRGSATPR